MARMRHIIAIPLQNESGALTRVAGLFSSRGYNIESLYVAPTDDPTVSRLTLVTTGNDAVIQQITKQSLKLIDVVNVEDVTREEHFERELLLIKVKAKATQVGSLWSATQRAGGRVLWDAADSFTDRADQQRGRHQPLRRRRLGLRRGARGGAQRRAGDPEGPSRPRKLSDISACLARGARAPAGRSGVPTAVRRTRRSPVAASRARPAPAAAPAPGRRVLASTYTCTKRPSAARLDLLVAEQADAVDHAASCRASRARGRRGPCPESSAR